MTPSLPLILFNIVAGLRDRLPKGYPVKKLLLLLWKTLLACLGGMKEVNRAKALSRELAGLAPDTNRKSCYRSVVLMIRFHKSISIRHQLFPSRHYGQIPNIRSWTYYLPPSPFGEIIRRNETPSSSNELPFHRNPTCSSIDIT